MTHPYHSLVWPRSQTVIELDQHRVSCCLCQRPTTRARYDLLPDGTRYYYCRSCHCLQYGEVE